MFASESVSRVRVARETGGLSCIPEGARSSSSALGKTSARGGTACRESARIIVAFALMRGFCAVSVLAKERESFSPRLWRGRGLTLYYGDRPTLAASVGLRAFLSNARIPQN